MVFTAACLTYMFITSVSTVIYFSTLRIVIQTSKQKKKRPHSGIQACGSSQLDSCGLSRHPRVLVTKARRLFPVYPDILIVCVTTLTDTLKHGIEACDACGGGQKLFTANFVRPWLSYDVIPCHLATAFITGWRDSTRPPCIAPVMLTVYLYGASKWPQQVLLARH